MKLSDLVDYKKRIQDMSIRGIDAQIHHELGDIVSTVTQYPLQFGDNSQQLVSQYETIQNSLIPFAGILKNIEQEIDKAILGLESRYFADSYRLYEDMVHETDEYILTRRFDDMGEDTYEFLQSRVAIYDDWRYPGMIIRPGLENFVKTLVGCDPLYLVDTSHDLLIPTRDRFSSAYQRRLRLYTINERQAEEPILKGLPDNQFGFVLAYNFFNFKPLQIIEQYFKEIYQKLRPGGTLVITFNNCDYAHGVKLTELHFMCYTPSRLIEELARRIGYEITFRYDTHSPNTWMEMSKPGTITSIRGGQALAEVKIKHSLGETNERPPT